MNNCDIELVIRSLRDADVYIEHIFMRGGCYQFHLFLKSIFPSATPYMHQDKDHIVTGINGELYDVRGMIEQQFKCMYSPLSNIDLEIVEKWSFSRTQVLQLCACPNCDEPIIYNGELI